MIKRTLISIGALSLFNGTVWAQTPEEAAQRSVERTNPANNSGQVSPSSSISFEQVLSAPGDVQLNIAYARQQIAAGDLKEGAATLERILLLNPGIADVRVLHGLVLYRLGILNRARYELETALEADNLSLDAREEAERYLENIKRLQSDTTGSLTLTTGFEWDHNRNQVTSSGQVLFIGIPIDANQNRISDFAHITSIQAAVKHDLGSQAGHTIQADLTYYRSDKDKVDTLDLDAIVATVGATAKFGRLSVTPSLRYGFFFLDGQEYLQSMGGEIDFSMYWKPSLRSYVTFRGEDEDFRVVTANSNRVTSALFREGRRMSLRAGTQWRYTPTLALRVEGLYMNKNGSEDASGDRSQDFNRYGLTVEHSALFKGGLFAIAAGQVESSDYAVAELFINPSRVREETLYRARATVGAPLSYLAGGIDLPKSVRDINLIAQYEYENVDANLLNYDYDTHKVSLLLSKRIPF